MDEHIAYSVVIDRHPKFAYQAWHLARSLRLHCGAKPDDIHIQTTDGVPERVRAVFRDEGYPVHALERFGDGKWCNKLAQLPNLADAPFDRVVLLDADTIAIADLRPFLTGDAVQAKIVDFANPSLAALTEIHARAGGREPILVRTDASDGQTLQGNANGGLYAIPRALAARFSAEWRRWAEWLLADDTILRREGKAAHVDQVSAALAFQLSGIPFRPAPSNLNYFIHVRARHRYYDSSRPIALIHYHDVSMNVVGLLEPPARLRRTEIAAVAQANAQIEAGFQNVLFWDYRYAAHPERGSGVGSRGDNLVYKRDLLRREGVEAAASVLDVGCGDLAVVRELRIDGYLGIDVSPGAIETAQAARPDWEFALHTGQEIAPRDMVLCFEVLIHQTTPEAYRALIAFLAEHANKTLIVSGYEHKEPRHMVFFHEPLSVSLARTKRFRDIRVVGAHTDVTIFRCDV